MSTTVEFEWDSRELAVWRDRSVDRALVRALAKAGGDAARALKADSSRRVRERKRLRVSRINRSLPIAFPTNKQDILALVWRMDVSGEVVPVAEYPHRQTKKGVSVEINRGQRKVIQSAFVAVLKSGHKGVFRRRGKERLPIDELFTTRVSDVFNDGGFVPAVLARAEGVFASAFARLLPLELDKL